MSSRAPRWPLLAAALSATLLTQGCATSRPLELDPGCCAAEPDELRTLLPQALAIVDAHPHSEVGEHALWLAFTLVRDHRDLPNLRRVSERLLAEYPTSASCAPALMELGRVEHETGDPAAALRALTMLLERFPRATEATTAARSIAVIRREQGDSATAARDLGAFASSNASVPEHLLELLADLQRESGAMPDALRTAERLATLDPDNATAAAVQLEQAVTDPDARLAPMLELLARAKNHVRSPEPSLARATGLVLDFWFRQLKRSPPKDRAATLAAEALISHDALRPADGSSDEATVAVIWRFATIFGALADSRTADEPQLAAGLREWSERWFTECVSRASLLGVTTPVVTACRNRESQLR